MTLLSVQSAPIADLTAVLRATAQHCIDQGRPMWPVDSLTTARLEQQYPDGQGHLGTLDGRPVAVMLVLPHDEQFWPEKPAGEALYLHKLAVHPAWQGRELGAQMVGAAVQLTRAAGRSWLRLDTTADRPKLRAIYEQLGFRLVREGVLDGWPMAWYELRI